ncbi:hypothetical protein M3Y99_01262300 [Aphelenchoides fujianensis]|nr:hypothetical protein M3Y99_01262300 [Aphelenchoides fujianensis]
MGAKKQGLSKSRKRTEASSPAIVAKPRRWPKRTPERCARAAVGIRSTTRWPNGPATTACTRGEPLSAAEIAQAAKDVEKRVLTFEPPPDEPDAKFVDVGPRKKLTNMLRPDGSMEIENLLHNIRSLFGVTDGGDPPLTAVQQVAIPHILLGTTDVSLVSRRAGGKTLAFAAPILHKVIRWKRAAKTMREKTGMFCLVVTPTAVVCSQVAALFAALARGTGVSVIHSSNKMITRAN